MKKFMSVETRSILAALAATSLTFSVATAATPLAIAQEAYLKASTLAAVMNSPGRSPCPATLS